MEKKKIIKKIIFYFKELDKKKIDRTLSSFSNLICWSKSPGYVKLKKLQTNKLDTNLFWILIKSLLCDNSFGSIKVYENIKITSNKFILSWCFKKNFIKRGIYHDTYFNINTQQTNNYSWILLSVDNFIPKEIPKNVIIFQINSNNFILRIFNLIKCFFYLLFTYNFSFVKIYHYIFNNTQSALNLFNKIKSKILLENINTLILPYEGQVLQKILIKEIRLANPKSKIFGYLHSSLPALPAEYIYDRNYCPDKLFYHGKSYKEILNRKLYWPKKNLKLIKSLRYDYFVSKKFKSDIYLPYDFTITNKKIYLDEFELFLKKNKKFNLKGCKVKIHPVYEKDKLHNNFKVKIENLLKKYFKKNRNKSKKIPIFFGSTTLFEGLEIFGEVIHICSDPVFEGLDKNFWPNLNVKKLSNFTFNYKLIKKGEYIIFGKKREKKIFLNLINNF